MPWTQADSYKHTHQATTAAKRKQWSDISNAVLARGGSDESAIRIANAQVKRHPSQKRVVRVSARRKKR